MSKDDFDFEFEFDDGSEEKPTIGGGQYEPVQYVSEDPVPEHLRPEYVLPDPDETEETPEEPKQSKGVKSKGVLVGAFVVLAGLLAVGAYALPSSEETVAEPAPTVEPAPIPTIPPIPVPVPTPVPVPEQTPAPSQEETAEPTTEPKPEKTEKPKEPTKEPKPENTEEPKPKPTKEPKPEPTKEPTKKPTKEPKPDKKPNTSLTTPVSSGPVVVPFICGNTISWSAPKGLKNSLSSAFAKVADATNNAYRFTYTGTSGGFIRISESKNTNGNKATASRSSASYRIGENDFEEDPTTRVDYLTGVTITVHPDSKDISPWIAQTGIGLPSASTSSYNNKAISDQAYESCEEVSAYPNASR